MFKMASQKYFKFSILLISIFVFVSLALAGTTETEELSRDVKFFLVNKMLNADKLELIPQNSTLKYLQKKHFKINSPIKILIHGFSQDKSSTFPTNIVNAYLNNSTTIDFNILVVDWGMLAGISMNKKTFSILKYKEAFENLPIVGDSVSSFLIRIQKLGAFKSYEDIHIIGFSLGAQLGGITGQKLFRKTHNKVGRITGLDPAGPMFYSTSLKGRLDPSDAKFVDVIHTNAGILGFSKTAGHVDIYPNGGRVQKGCSNDWTGICSHKKATVIYEQSIIQPTSLRACACYSWEDYSLKCKNECFNHIFIGESCPRTAYGQYFLDFD